MPRRESFLNDVTHVLRQMILVLSMAISALCGISLMLSPVAGTSQFLSLLLCSVARLLSILTRVFTQSRSCLFNVISQSHCMLSPQAQKHCI